MPGSSTPDVATGIVVTFPNITLNSSEALAMKVYDLDCDFSIELLEITNFSSTAPNATTQIGGREFLPADFSSFLTVTLTTDFDVTDLKRMIGLAPAQCYISFPGGTHGNLGNGQLEGDAMITSVNPSFAPNELITCSMTIQFTGAVTFTTIP